MAELLEVLLRGVEEPADPQDGDCMDLSHEITHTLWAAGQMAAKTVVAYGWIKMNDQPAILFGHWVTRCDGWIIDFTARQFNPELPARWFAREEPYKILLAKYTGAEHVKIGL